MYKCCSLACFCASQRIQRRKAELTLAQIREKLPNGCTVSQIQKSGEAVKRLDRLAPHLAQICISIWEWIYANQIAPRDTRGQFGVFLGGTNYNVWGSCQTARTIGTKFHTCLRIRLGIDIAKYNSPLNTTGALGGFRGSQI